MDTVCVDIIIAGSGFGGSLLGWILARYGYRVAMFDPVAHPRFAIGESSTPIADMILADLAHRYSLAALAPLAQYGTWCQTYPQLLRGRKRGFSYFFHHPGEPFQPLPHHGSELLVAASADDWRCDTHWYRAHVDAFLAEKAVEAGVSYFAPAEAQFATSQSGRWTVRLALAQGSVLLEGHLLIDASGGQFGRRWLDVGDATWQLRTYSQAIYTHLSGVTGWQSMLEAMNYETSHHPFDCDRAALHHVFPGGWMWQLRFDNDVVSVGVAWGSSTLPPGANPQEQVLSFVRQFPSIASQLQEARLVDSPGRWIFSGRLQRKAVRAVGENWVLLPHAYGFIDPLHSTGIAHTLSGVERLAALLTDDPFPPPGEGLRNYQSQLQAEIHLVDELVHAAYCNTHSFDRFILATMLYFTVTVWYESLRRNGQPTRAFLCADDPQLSEVIAEGCRLLRADRPPEDHPVRQEGGLASEQDRQLYESIRALIGPFNRAGLLHPAAENMYRHTAAR